MRPRLSGPDAPSLAVLSRRVLVLGFAVVNGLVGLVLFWDHSAVDGVDWIEAVAAACICFGLAWLGWGAATGLIGLFWRAPRPDAGPPVPLTGTTVVLVPVYNEDPAATFARVAAMGDGLRRLGQQDRFHFAILSDSTALDIAADEMAWFARLAREMDDIRVFYRRRERNLGRKAGNIADFVTRSGSAYDYAVILDADSLMAADTLVTMARRMEADPRLGLIQTLPQIVSARSLFGRVIQFSANYYSTAFAAGTALLQGAEGPYWGHNAIVRMSAFAQSCGLPALSGKPPFGGQILSHDYVEAALLARAGWKVELHPDLGGSYEEGPENLIEFAKRDRRWCQGNLQYTRLLLAPRLRLWSRVVFAQGIMSYLASPIWLAFLSLATLAADRSGPVRGSYITGTTAPALWLAAQVALLLVVPRLLILLRGAFDGRNRQVGGSLPATLSVLLEIVFTSLIAPIMLMLQCRAVLQILAGRDGGWPATSRAQSSLSWSSVWATTGWMTWLGLVVLAVALWVVPQALIWLLPVVVPVIAAPVLSRWSSLTLGPDWLFATPQQLVVPAVDAERHRVRIAWTNRSDIADLRA